MSGDPSVTSKETTFDPACSGRSHGWAMRIENARFWTCQTCGACVVDMDGSQDALDLHRAWHQAQQK